MKRRVTPVRYSIEFHEENEDNVTFFAADILAKTGLMPVDACDIIGQQLRNRGYSVPFIETRDERMLIQDFWAAVSVADGDHETW